ncbi:MAG: hypothetical protein V2A78_10515 [bacterium]
MKFGKLFMFLLFLLLVLILAVAYLKNRAGEEELRAKHLREQLSQRQAETAAQALKMEAKSPRAEREKNWPGTFIPPPPTTSRQDLNSTIKDLTILVKKQNRIIESLIKALNYYKKASIQMPKTEKFNPRNEPPPAPPAPPAQTPLPVPPTSQAVSTIPPANQAPSRWTKEDEQRFRDREAQKLKARQELDQEILKNTQQLKEEAQKYDKYFQNIKPKGDFKELERVKGKLLEGNN